MRGIRIGGVQIRLKRRGRLLLAALIACVLMLGAPRAFGARAVEPEADLVTVVVQAGDTLWGLATAHGPAGVDPRYTVDRIRRLNRLTTAGIHPGQVLVIPTSR